MPSLVPSSSNIATGPDALLYTPGPLTTSPSVKEAMLHDKGARDADFLDIVRDIRHRLLSLAGVSQASGYEAVLIQGSGTYAVEATISCAVPKSGNGGGKLLVLANGAYGDRMGAIAHAHNIDVEIIQHSQTQPIHASHLTDALARTEDVTHIAVVHCETSTGVQNDVEAIGAVAYQHGLTYIIDAMSSLGGIPFDMPASGADYVVSSANKCIQGVPGFAFVLCKNEALHACKGNERTLTLDLYAQWLGLERGGEFRFTPPTHTLLACHKALNELDKEGGVQARYKRYTQNHLMLRDGMYSMGFTCQVADNDQAPIITSFDEPNHPNFTFEKFYQELAKRGHLVYSGKIPGTACFRIGNIGHLFPSDIQDLLVAIAQTLEVMDVPIADRVTA